jgi:hypothetical protein
MNMQKFVESLCEQEKTELREILFETTTVNLFPTDREQQLWGRSDTWIQAVKEYRTRTFSTLADAKKAFETAFGRHGY